MSQHNNYKKYSALIYDYETLKSAIVTDMSLEIRELKKNLKDAIEVIEPIVKYYDSTDIERGHEEETDFKDPEYCIWEDCKEFLQTIKEKK